MSSDRITLKDIAKKLGVSPSTVSRALKGNPEIGEDTVKSVLKLAEELNYRPNTLAMSLRSKKTYTIGVIVPEIVHYFFSSVISGIEFVAYDSNYQVILCQSNELYRQEVMNLKTLEQSQVDGVLMSFAKETRDFGHIEEVRSKGIPVVFYDRSFAGINIDSVLVDDIGGAYEATDHLIKMGCRKIVHFNGPLHLEIHAARRNGYVDALKYHNLPIIEELIIEADSFKRAYKFTLRMLEEGVDFDAIFAVNDLTAVGAMKALKSKGLRIPQDVAVVGFGNDSTLSEMVDPSLSSVMQPGFDMGKEATNLLLNKINEKIHQEPVQIRLKTKLKVRKSSQRL
ncbi:MAG: LacI family transcriptional regulator [Cyclobacteriaceae bacterium]|nr:LacI family transcriptional regulator [Cyclobacteriaceae bacterium]